MILFSFYFMSQIIEIHHASLTHVKLQFTSYSEAVEHFLKYFSQHAGLVLSLLNFISVSRSDFRWVLNQMWTTVFICELKEPPAGYVFILSLLVMWMENNLSLCYGLHKIPSFYWPPSFHHTNFHIQLNGFPLETIMSTLTKFKWESISELMRSELFGALMRNRLCIYWI